ncbi:type II toxin-antitoxin system VapC family toxin [Patescibacteria group bacterium]|nr:type II toxin-antitoxin system VapC family toxin [Patescibacteria group bacterium]MCG2701693.1 type II toxin-antitoxin system VapC family toxin [Candidatus Parcubacteria bacterium]MBU4265372.1 type II toxin-antitoxin system VapC family toxin [Patescibacteria group bacterium]MBU4390324.1 type II toxin-antitoxin system VapC family toxin [Patescibacteria group bacterium]MBU4396571.1 type II toxin-antitoxin system VapC family toxin [Patescibacteria group bacterium]
MYVDTNILIHILVDDSTGKTELLKNYFIENEDEIFDIRFTVVMESFWVLTSKRMGLSIKKAVDELINLLSSDLFEVEKLDECLDILNLIKKKTFLDWVDAEIYLKSKSEKTKVLSFDEDFDKLGKKVRFVV